MSDARPLATTLVVGPSGAGKTGLIERWLAARPAGARWALLAQGLAAPAIAGALLPDAARLQLAGGCACCSARPVFEAALARLLRRGPWSRLLIEAGGSAHAASLVDLLRGPGLARSLQLEGIVAVADAGRIEAQLAGPAAERVAGQLDAACRIVLTRTDDLSANQAESLVERLRSRSPFPRPIEPIEVSLLPGEETEEGWPALLPAGDAGRLLAELGARLKESVERPVGACRSTIRMRWSSAQVFDRRQLMEASTHWQMAEGAVGGRAVFRTTRDGYAWRFDGRRASWQPSGWRCDSRFELTLRGSPEPSGGSNGRL